jgi:NADH-quinone oxidoreductase subunit K
MMVVPVSAYVILAAVIFGIGAIGVLISRNMIILFMCIELMLNAANLVLIAFSRALNVIDGHVIVFLVLTVAAAEAAVGLAMIITIYRNWESINIDRLNLMKW